MLLMQDRQLLLLDEPVAGMTDHETERRPSCCSTSRGSAPSSWSSTTWSSSGRSGAKVTVLHEGSVLAEGSIDTVQATTGSSKSIWGAEETCDRRERRSLLRRSHTCAASGSTAPKGASPAFWAATASARPAAARRPGPGCRSARAASAGRTGIRQRLPTSGARLASPTCRRAGRSSRGSRCGRTSDRLRPPARRHRRSPNEIFELFPVLKACCTGAAAISPAASSSSSPSPAPW